MDVSESLPGDEIIRIGLQDLASGAESIPALLVSIGAPRLRRLGLEIPKTFPAPEKRLYALLEKGGADSAQSRDPALLRRLVSYERAAECAAR